METPDYNKIITNIILSYNIEGVDLLDKKFSIEQRLDAYSKEYESLGKSFFIDMIFEIAKTMTKTSEFVKNKLIQQGILEIILEYCKNRSNESKHIKYFKDPENFWKIVTPIITLILGFFFGLLINWLKC